MKHILLIDDCEDFRTTSTQVLSHAGYLVSAVATPKDAFLFLKNDAVDLIICDLHMPFTIGEDAKDYLTSTEVGFRTAKELNWALPQIPLIVLSSFPQIDLLRFSKFLDPIRAFTKPAKAEELVRIVEYALEVREPVYYQ